jgi:hypothetical protein
VRAPIKRGFWGHVKIYAAKNLVRHESDSKKEQEKANISKAMLLVIKSGLL